MVVVKLESYTINDIPGAFYKGNLKHLIHQELKCNRGVPTVVLDASAFKSHRFSGSQWRTKTVKKSVQNFVKNITSCGANLIVVLRGNCINCAEVWFENKKKKLKQGKTELNNIIMGKLPEVGWPFIDYCIQNTFASISANRYKVFRSVENVDKEVARIAITQNCLAVIGQDSNYFIYEGIKYYILTKGLNSKTLDCLIFKREKLIEHLGLKSHHLPLFATLCGNNVISYSNLYNFYKKIKQPSINQFLSVAGFVKMSDDPYECIEEVVKLIKHPEIQDKLIKKSLDFYLNFEEVVPENKWTVFANERKRHLKWLDVLHEIFTLREFRCVQVTGLTPDSLTTLSFLKPLRQKVYGIVLHESESKTVAEYHVEKMADPNKVEFFIPVHVPAVEPECDHPGLIELYDDETPNVYTLRWNLFCSSISKALTPTLVKTIPPGLRFPVLALHYLEIEVPRLLSQKIFNHRFEVEAFLVVAVLIHENISINQFSPFAGMEARVVDLIVKFKEVCFTLRMLNEACNMVISLEQSCPCNYFDGLLYHFVYEYMRKGANWSDFLGRNIALEILYTTLLELVVQDV